MSDFKNIKFHGLHFTSKELMDAKKDHIKIDKLLYSASCHNTNEISQANLHNLDFITLSPVLSSKNAAEVLGWKKFKSLSSIANMPVYALGGIKPEDIDMVHKNGGYGISGISNFLL